MRHRAQEIGVSTNTLYRMLTKFLKLHAYKIHLTQELTLEDHGQRRVVVKLILEQRQLDSFFNKNHL